MTEIDYGRLDALEAILGGRAAINDAYLKGKSYGAPGSVVSVPSGVGAGGAIGAARGTGNAGVAVLRDVVSILDFSGADRTGASDSATALKNAMTEAAALAVGGYGSSQGVGVHVPGGRWLLGSKIAIPPGITLLCDGFNSTAFQIPTAFPDNCVIEPQNLDGTQEYMGAQGFIIYGQGGSSPSSNQANPGSATTVATTISNPINSPAFDLVVTGIGLNYASNGTLLVGGAKRIVYQSFTEGGGNTTFHKCWITSGYGTSFGGASGLAINSGDTVTAVTTNNVVGIRYVGNGATSLLRDVASISFTDNCIQALWCNCLDLDNVWGNISNRDTILVDGGSAHSWFRGITAQYPDAADTGSGFAALHIRGFSSNMNWMGNIGIDGLYMELSAHNAKGLWIDNTGHISGGNIRLVGGQNLGGTSFATHTMVQLDSAQTNPTATDGQHSGGIALRNLLSGGDGRVTLRDNVRGYVTPANSGGLGTGVTDYSTESQGPIGFVTREARLRRGVLPAYAETLPFDVATNANPLLPVSGTQQGGTVPLLGGVGYNTVTLAVANSQGATWGTNGDGHWYVAIYDPSGNLVVQTADQGGAGLGAGVAPIVALQSTLTPAQDGSYQVVLMVYIGTGGSPVMPKMLGLSGIISTRPASGMPRKSFTANTLLTTGVAPNTLGTLAGNSSLFWIAVYHT